MPPSTNAAKPIIPMNIISSFARTTLPSMRMQRLAICAAAVLLTACADMSGILTTTHSNTAAEYATAKSLPDEGGQWPDASWVISIGGTPLQQLTNEALAGNPDLQVAAARVAAARAMVEAAGAGAKPKVGASFSTTRQRFTENSIYPPPFGGLYVTDNELALNFSYDLDFWDKHGAELRSALSQSKAAEAEHYASRLILTTAVAKAWIQLARQYAQLDLSNQQLVLRDQLDRLTQQRFGAGLDTQSDNQQSHLQVATLRNEQAQWIEAISLTRNQLAALLGQGPDRGLLILKPTLPTETSIALPDQLPIGLIGRRADIVAARWQVEAAQSDIKVAKTEFYPNVNLSAMVGLSSLGWNNFLSKSSMVNGIGPAIHLPIFEGGALRAQLKGRVAAYDGAVATYNKTLTDALREVSDQVLSLRATEIVRTNQEAASKAAERSMRLAQQRQQVGTANMLQVVATQIAYLSQQKLELDTRAHRADLRIGLIKSLGGGFDADTEGLPPEAGSAPDAKKSSGNNPLSNRPPLANTAP